MRRLSWLAAVSLMAVAGCRSAPEVPAPDPTAPDRNANWFCEMGEKEDEWACVESGELAGAGGQSAVEPAQESVMAPAASNPPTSTRQAAPAPTPPAPAAVSPRTAATPPPAARAATPQRTAAPPSTPASPDMPLYRRLAYRPAGYVRLNELPPEFYVVQLVAVQTREALEEYAAREQLKNMTAARVERGGKLFYVLLLGIYEDRVRADRAATSLPPEFEDFEPWVRSLGSLQEAIARGDELAGTDVI